MIEMIKKVRERAILDRIKVEAKIEFADSLISAYEEQSTTPICEENTEIADEGIDTYQSNDNTII